MAVLNFLLSVIMFSTLYNVPLYFSSVKLASSSNSGSHLIPNSVCLSSPIPLSCPHAELMSLLALIRSLALLHHSSLDS